MQTQAAKMREFTSVREMQAHYAAIRKRRLAVRAIEELTKPMPAKISEPTTPNNYFLSDDRYVELYVIERASEPLPIVPAKIRVIQERVARFYDSQVIDMISQRRDRKACWPRQIAMYLCKTRTTKSLPEIGRRFGGRDHTTVLHAVRKIAELRPSDMKLDGELRELEAGLAG